MSLLVLKNAKATILVFEGTVNTLSGEEEEEEVDKKEGEGEEE